MGGVTAAAGRKTDQVTAVPPPADPAASAPVVYRPRGGFRLRTTISSSVLLVVSLALLVPALASGSYGGVAILLALALGAVAILVGMRREGVTVTDRELVVAGKLRTERVPLAAVTAVHHQDERGVTTWVDAADRRPFRIHTLTGQPEAIDDLRARARRAGADLDPAAPKVGTPPPGTRTLFTLL